MEGARNGSLLVLNTANQDIATEIVLNCGGFELKDTKTVTVRAKCVPGAEDEDQTGDHEVVVPAVLTDEQAASCVLDRFHSDVAIDNLDDWEFSVLDGDWDLAEADNAESYRYA